MREKSVGSQAKELTLPNRLFESVPIHQLEINPLSTYKEGNSTGQSLYFQVEQTLP